MHAYFVLKLLPRCYPRFVGQSSCWIVNNALPKCLTLLSILYARILQDVLNQLIELLLLLCHKVLSFPCSSGCNNIGFWCCHARKWQNSHTRSSRSQWQLSSLYGLLTSLVSSTKLWRPTWDVMVHCFICGIGDHWSALFLLFIGGNDKLQLQTLLLPPIRGRTLKTPTQTLWVLVSHHAWHLHSSLHGFAIQVFH